MVITKQARETFKSRTSSFWKCSPERRPCWWRMSTKLELIVVHKLDFLLQDRDAPIHVVFQQWLQNRPNVLRHLAKEEIPVTNKMWKAPHPHLSQADKMGMHSTAVLGPPCCPECSMLHAAWHKDGMATLEDSFSQTRCALTWFAQWWWCPYHRGTCVRLLFTIVKTNVGPRCLLVGGLYKL